MRLTSLFFLVLLFGCLPPPPSCDGGTCDDLRAGDEDLGLRTEEDLGGADLRAGDLRSADLPPGAIDPGRAGGRRVLRFDLRVPLGPGAVLSTTILGPTDDGADLSRAAAPYPLVVISPGFTLPRTQFAAYGERLASHGFLVVLQDPRSCGLLGCDHEAYRKDLIQLLDWLLSPTGPDAARLQGRADPLHIGATGHSLGGKMSLLLAAKDRRVKAVLGIDPVDSGVGMQPKAAEEIGMIAAPIGLLGETVSQMGGTPCAPAGQNYEALYSAARAPAFAITFVGAAHNDFVDDFMACLQCGFCPGGTAPKARTHDLAVKYVAAYFLKTLLGIAAAEDYLSGASFAADQLTGAVTRTAK